MKIEDKDLEIGCLIDNKQRVGNTIINVGTPSAGVRIKHIPTGYIVGVQKSRSQYQNRKIAMDFLQAMLEENPK